MASNKKGEELQEILSSYHVLHIYIYVARKNCFIMHQERLLYFYIYFRFICIPANELTVIFLQPGRLSARRRSRLLDHH